MALFCLVHVHCDIKSIHQIIFPGRKKQIRRATLKETSTLHSEICLYISQIVYLQHPAFHIIYHYD